MKPIKRLLLSLFIAAGVVTGLSPAVFAEATLFEQANAKYKAGDYKGASALYQKITELGRPSAAVYYNLGNAALKSGEKGQALLSYLRAVRMAPRDKDLDWNIHVLKGALSDKLEDRSHFAVIAVKNVLSKITINEAAAVFIVCLAVLSFFSLLVFFFPAFSGWAGKIGILIWIIFTVWSGVFALKYWDAKDRRVVVMDKEIYTYYGPSDKETKAFLLHEGAEGRVLDESGEWFYISLANRNTGWLRKNACEIV